MSWENSLYISLTLSFIVSLIVIKLVHSLDFLIILLTISALLAFGLPLPLIGSKSLSVTLSSLSPCHLSSFSLSLSLSVSFSFFLLSFFLSLSLSGNSVCIQTERLKFYALSVSGNYVRLRTDGLTRTIF